MWILEVIIIKYLLLTIYYVLFISTFLFLISILKGMLITFHLKVTCSAD